MKTKIAFLLISTIFMTSVHAIEPVAKIIEQLESPLQITDYSASYRTGSTYTSEGIRHAVKFKNISQQAIVAIQIGLVSFDIWNEFLDRTGGVSIQDIAPGISGSGTWVANAYGDFAFLTGFAYVSKVRFSDGTIWNADIEKIADELRKIEIDFDVKVLKSDSKK